MKRFPNHSRETTPEAALASFNQVDEKFGMVPNLIRKMSTAPVLAEAYLTLSDIFEKGGFSETERQVVLLAASYSNNCEYCVGAHSVIADMFKVPADVTDAIRDNQPINDSKLQALRQFVHRVTERRAVLDEDEMASFFAAGYGPQHVLEVILGIGLKTLSNYTNHLAGTELDAGFAHRSWSKPGVS